jgi:anoctamin-10
MYALFMALWATLFIEKWKNLTWELKYLWDMHDFKERQPQRIMYTG